MVWPADLPQNRVYRPDTRHLLCLRRYRLAVEREKNWNPAFSSCPFERAGCIVGLDAIPQYPFLKLARIPAFLLEIPSFSRFLHLVRTRFHFFPNTMRIRLRTHSYDAGIASMAQTLSLEKMSKLTEYENTCSSLREYAAKYGFLAGLFCGFKQSFTLKHESDGGFAKHVSDEIHKMPQMMRNREYYAKIEHRNHLAETLEAEVGCKNQYHLVSLACAWEQRAYSASIDGFYLGYHAAVAILEEVDLGSFPGLQMEGKILCMEHQLGFIRKRKD